MSEFFCWEIRIHNFKFNRNARGFNIGLSPLGAHVKVQAWLNLGRDATCVWSSDHSEYRTHPSATEAFLLSLISGQYIDLFVKIDACRVGVDRWGDKLSQTFQYMKKNKAFGRFRQVSAWRHAEAFVKKDN